MATSLLPSSQKRPELLRNRVPKQKDKIRNGCLTPTFSGAQKRAEFKELLKT